MLALVTLVSLPSALIWDVMAGQPIRLPQHATTTTHPSHTQATTPIRHPRPHNPPLHSPPLHASARPAHAAHTSAPPPTTVNGTAIAIGLIVLLTTLALFVARTIRLQPQTAPGSESHDPDTDEMLTQPDAGQPAQNPQLEQGAQPDPNAEPVQNAEPDTPDQADDQAHDQPLVSVVAEVEQALRKPIPLTADTAAEATATVKPPADHSTAGAASDCPPGTGPVILYDRRLAQRVTYQSKARLQWDAHDVACISEDISMRGVRLRFPQDPPAAPPPPPEGTPVRVTLTLDGALTTLTARVGWQRSDQASPLLGLQFLGIHKRHETLLQPIVLRGTPT